VKTGKNLPSVFRQEVNGLIELINIQRAVFQLCLGRE
jgi:hypothetical protein